MFTFYMPAILTMGSDLHAKRSMLLLLPTQLVANVTSLRGLVAEIIAETDAAGGNSDRRAHSGLVNEDGNRASTASNAPDADQRDGDTSNKGNGGATASATTMGLSSTAPLGVGGLTN